METIDYRGFTGTAEVDLDRGVCRGKLLFINDLVTYESDSVSGLKAEFQAAVEDYLETCKSLGREPQRPCGGQFNVRIDPALHRAAILRAHRDDVTLNRVIARAVEAYLTPIQAVNNHHVNITLQAPQETMETVLASGSGEQWRNFNYVQ